MKAVMYGSGNIGRGFIGYLMAQSGYEVTFIDISEQVVNTLSAEKRYPIRIVSSDCYEDIEVSGVTAVNGNDCEAVAKAIAEADLMATAVGVNVLKYIIPNIAAGLKQRFSTTDKPLNIIICENLIDANKIIEGMLKVEMSQEEQQLLDERIGLVEASIGRMVPVQTPDMQDGEPLRVCVERYGFLPVDLAAFKGDIPKLHNIVPYEPFDYYIQRKLYLHNMGHATCAYLGNLTSQEYIYQSIADPSTKIIVKNAMLESAIALSKKYDIPFSNLYAHINDLLTRFSNAALKDTCARVGGDAKRKLSPSDRLIGTLNLCVEQGINPVHVCVGIAGALSHYMNENNLDQTKENTLKVLQDVSNLNNKQLIDIILHFYNLTLEKASTTDLSNEAERLTIELQGDVV